MTVGHKDRRGIFVSEADRDGLLHKLGTYYFWNVVCEHNSGISTKDAFGENYENTFAPDGHIRTALTIDENQSSDIAGLVSHSKNVTEINLNI